MVWSGAGGGHVPPDGAAGISAGAQQGGDSLANPGTRLDLPRSRPTAAAGSPPPPPDGGDLWGGPQTPTITPQPQLCANNPWQGAGAGACHESLLAPTRPVSQSQGAVFQVSPSLGTPWERQGGVGASLKAWLGPAVWVQGEKRAGVIGSRCQTDGRRGPPDRAR